MAGRRAGGQRARWLLVQRLWILHLANMTMVFEEPACVWDDSQNAAIRHYWTDIPELHERFPPTPGFPEGIMVHTPATAIHEFGHTAGLWDLYKATLAAAESTPYPGYVMSTELPAPYHSWM